MESWNLIEMLVSMFSCAHGVLLADSFSNGRVIALDLVKKCISSLHIFCQHNLMDFIENFASEPIQSLIIQMISFSKLI